MESKRVEASDGKKQYKHQLVGSYNIWHLVSNDHVGIMEKLRTPRVFHFVFDSLPVYNYIANKCCSNLFNNLMLIIDDLIMGTKYRMSTALLIGDLMKKCLTGNEY